MQYPKYSSFFPQKISAMDLMFAQAQAQAAALAAAQYYANCNMPAVSQHGGPFVPGTTVAPPPPPGTTLAFAPPAPPVLSGTQVLGPQFIVQQQHHHQQPHPQPQPPPQPPPMPTISHHGER